LPNVFQNGSSSIREAASSEEPEPEPFLEEPEPCQTGAKHGEEGTSGDWGGSREAMKAAKKFRSQAGTFRLPTVVWAGEAKICFLRHRGGRARQSSVD
jgi:hypothetical protein